MKNDDNSFGTIAAEEARSEANGHSDAKRDNLLKRGMAMIYGGTGIDLDALMTPEECAAWLKIEKRTLIAKNARRNRIPVVKINQRVFRFHPRSILAAKGIKL